MQASHLLSDSLSIREIQPVAIETQWQSIGFATLFDWVRLQCASGNNCEFALRCISVHLGGLFSRLYHLRLHVICKFRWLSWRFK